VPDLFDVPAMAQSVDPAIRNPYTKLREAVQRLIAARRAGTDTVSTGGGGGTAGSPGEAGPPGPPGPPGDPGVYVPDLTPPPNVTGLTVTSGFSYVFVEWDAAVYTQGHGHLQTNIYAAQRVSSDASLPVFADAVLVYSATGALTIAALASTLGIRWHVWAKYETADNVQSVAPAGGANGVVATVGKIGNSDLGPLIIEASNLAAMDFSNLVSNPEGRQGTSGWFPANASDQVAAVLNPGAFPFWAGYALSMKYRDLFFGQTFAVKPGDEFQLHLEGIPSGGGASTFPLQLGLQTLGPDGTSVLTFSTAVVLPAAGAGLRTGDGGLTMAAGTAFARVWISIPQATGGTVLWYFSRVDVRRKPSKLAVNTIVAGDGAIANFAIGNALIGNAAIDDAKVANLSAAKLTVGDGTIGGNLKSANYVAGVSGWLVQPNGTAEFSFAHIRGVLQAGQITAGYISTAMFQASSVTTNELAAGAVTAAKMSVTSLDAITATIGLLRTATSGARVEIGSNYGKVYDASNVKRVQWGDLTA
jgi:hypothetical protein